MADFKAGSGAPPSYVADQQASYPVQPQQPYSGDHIGHAASPPLQQQQPLQQQPPIQHNDSNFSQEKGTHANAGTPGPQTPGAAQQMATAGYQTAMPIGSLGAGAAPIDCPACNMRQMTRIEYKSGGTTWAWAAGVCICLGCGCIPFCINSTKDVIHFCGHCGTKVAQWHRSGHTEVVLHR